MILKISSCLRWVLECLHIVPIETKVIAIESKVNAIESKINDIESKINDIDCEIKCLNIAVAADVSSLINWHNNNKVMLNEINNVSRQLIIGLDNESRTRKETEAQLMAAISMMTSEINRVAGIMDQQIQSKNHDHHK